MLCDDCRQIAVSQVIRSGELESGVGPRSFRVVVDIGKRHGHRVAQTGLRKKWRTFRKSRKALFAPRPHFVVRKENDLYE